MQSILSIFLWTLGEAMNQVWANKTMQSRLSTYFLYCKKHVALTRNSSLHLIFPPKNEALNRDSQISSH